MPDGLLMLRMPSISNNAPAPYMRRDDFINLADHPGSHFFERAIEYAAYSVLMPAASERTGEAGEVDPSFGAHADLVLCLSRLPEKDRDFHPLHRSDKVDKIFRVFCRCSGLAVKFVRDNDPCNPSILTPFHSG